MLLLATFSEIPRPNRGGEIRAGWPDPALSLFAFRSFVVAYQQLKSFFFVDDMSTVDTRTTRLHDDEVIVVGHAAGSGDRLAVSLELWYPFIARSHPKLALLDGPGGDGEVFEFCPVSA
jgi:hypothetical protein